MAGLLYDPTKPLPLIEMVNNPAWMGVKPTLGQRNNNYGNLRTNDPFEGKTGVNKTYDTYETPEKGMRALARVLDTYSSKHGINTIDQLINRYAPASDNTGGSHENYKKFLAQRLGVNPNAPIDVKGRRADIMDAIIRFENKNRPLASREQLTQAIADADGTQENAQGTEPMNQFFGYHQDGAGEFASPARQAVTLPALSANSSQNAQTLPAQDSDGYGAMRLLNFTEAQITEAKRKGIPAEFYTAQAGLNNGVLAEPNAQLDPEVDVSLRGPVGTGPVLAAPTVIQGDGSELEGAETGGILVTPANAGALDPNMPSGEGILNQSQLPPEPKMAQVSGQRRNQSPMSLQSASPAIDFNDMLIRMGGRGVEASQRGGLAAFGAVTEEYGKIQDANQSAALDAYKSQLSASKKTSKQSADDQERIGQIDATMADMSRAKQALKGGGVTGLFDATFGAGWDKLVGNDKQQNARMLLQKLRVDDTLLRIAQTKGAISNKEMDLFLSPSPELTDQESVWVRWIEDREQALMRVRSRLSGGQQVDPSEQASEGQVNQFGSQVSTGSFNVGQSQKINGVEVKRTK